MQSKIPQNRWLVLPAFFLWLLGQAAETGKKRLQKKIASGREPDANAYAHIVNAAADPTASLVFHRFTSSSDGALRTQSRIKHIGMMLLIRVIILFSLAASIMTLFGLLTALPHIQALEIEGNVHYTKEEIGNIAAEAGVNKGGEVYAFTPETVCKAIRATCPYVASVSVSRSVGGVVWIRLRERTPVWLCRVGDKYVLLDEDFTVLEEITGENADTAFITVTIRTDEGTETAVGKSLVCAESVRKELLAWTKVLPLLQEAKVQSLDLTDQQTVRLLLEDQTSIQLGCEMDISYMLRAVTEAMEAYRRKTGTYLPLRVDVDSNANVRITLREQNNSR